MPTDGQTSEYLVCRVEHCGWMVRFIPAAAQEAEAARVYHEWSEHFYLEPE